MFRGGRSLEVEGNGSSAAVVGMKFAGDVRIEKAAPSQIRRLQSGRGGKFPKECGASAVGFATISMSEVKRVVLG
jgi:hypothetical protein